MNRTEWLEKIYEHVKGDLDEQRCVEAAVEINVELWHLHNERAGRRQLLTDLKALERRRLRKLDRETVRRPSGQVHLFDPSSYGEPVERLLRERIRIDDASVDIALLAGAEGGQTLIDYASRERKKAGTLLTRCRLYEAVGEHVIAETRRLSRDVSVAEVCGWEKAA